MNICLVIVTYNRWATLRETLGCIKAQSVQPVWTVVVDNASQDDTVARLEREWPEITVLKLQENVGYGAALSFGMKLSASRHADIDFFWLMDDDSHPGAEALEMLLEARRKVNHPGIISYTGFNDNWWKGPVRFSAYAKKKGLTGSLPYPVDHVLIDGALVDRVVVDKVGTPREDLFMMCEDVEYSKRIKTSGYHVSVLLREDLMNRLHMGASKLTKGTLWRGYYHSRNHLSILRQYFSWRDLVMYIIRQLKYLAAAFSLRDRFERVRLRLLGILHGLTGRMGKTIDPLDYR